MKQEIEHTEIEITPLCKNGSHRHGVLAKCKYWLKGSKLKIDVEQFGKTEEEAREKLLKFLNN